MKLFVLLCFTLLCQLNCVQGERRRPPPWAPPERLPNADARTDIATQHVSGPDNSNHATLPHDDQTQRRGLLEEIRKSLFLGSKSSSEKTLDRGDKKVDPDPVESEAPPRVDLLELEQLKDRPDSLDMMQELVPKFPVVYRFFPKSRIRSVNSGSVPFILLGPNVDHWKVTGQELASQGFNVFACERLASADEDDKEPAVLSPEQCTDFIVQLLDALRWPQAVLVGCDTEAALALYAAKELSPERLVGLVLCGALDDSVHQVTGNRRDLDGLGLDRFMEEHLQCPFTIIWDGDAPSIPIPADASSADLWRSHRTIVLGGGLSPHRRRPEMLSWVLARFVEEKIAPTLMAQSSSPHARGGQQDAVDPTNPSRDASSGMGLPLFSDGYVVVYGRVVATIIFYLMVFKVLVYHYENLRWSMLHIKTTVEKIESVRRYIAVALGTLLKRCVPWFLKLLPGEDNQERNEIVIDMHEAAEDNHDDDDNNNNIDDTDHQATENPTDDENHHEKIDQHNNSTEGDHIQKHKPLIQPRRRDPPHFLDNVVT